MISVSSLVPFRTKLSCFRVFRGRVHVRFSCGNTDSFGVSIKDNRKCHVVDMKVLCSTYTSTAMDELDYLQSQEKGETNI